MKFFYKIFLSMLLVLTVSLATIEYLTVSYSLEHALQREENTALSQHQMAKYSIQTVLLGITDDLHNVQISENIAKSAETASWCIESGLFLPVRTASQGEMRQCIIIPVRSILRTDTGDGNTGIRDMGNRKRQISAG